MSKAVHRTLEAKLAALQGASTRRRNLLFNTHVSRFDVITLSLGPEWDSSDEETPIVPLESNKKRVLAAKVSTKPKKKLKQKKPKQSRVIYIGHLPRSFEEPELLGFLSQFGVVTKVKLSRSRKTANPRGFCFCEFANSEVASIVAETMNGYFLQDKRLVCHVVPLEKIRANLFDGHDRAFTKVDWQARHREQVNKEKPADVMNVITKRLLAREEKKKAALKAVGIEYDYPGYKASAEIVQQETTSPALKTTNDLSDKKKKRRKESMDEQTDMESPKKKKRSMSESSDASAKKKKSRKDSIDSLGSSSSGKKEKKSRKDSIGSHGGSLSDKKKHSKRTDSIDSHASSSEKKKNREDSMDSHGSSSSNRKHSKRVSSDDMQAEDTPKAKPKSSRKHSDAKTEMKKKKKAEKKRRAST